MAIETVSPLLSDPPAPAEKSAGEPDQNFIDTVDAGYVETLEAFGARMDLRKARRLTGLLAAASLLLLALGRRINRGGTS
ncbi:hypothetical protein ACWGHD_04270 [Streptomyces xanthophaeus]